MKRLYLIILGITLIGYMNAFGEQPSGETFEYRDNALFHSNRLHDLNQPLILNPIYILVSEFAEGRYIRGDLKENGFELYDGKKLMMKKHIKRHMFTFRTRFYVDEGLSHEQLSLYMGLTGYPRAIFLNGIKIQTFGRYRDDYNTHAYFPHNIYLSGDILHYGDTPNELSIQAYPEKDNHPLEDLVIDSYYRNAGKVFLRTFIGISLVQAAVVVSFIIFFYMLFLFITMNFKDFTFLYFGLTCLFYGFSYFNMCFLSDGYSQIPLEIVSRTVFPWTGLFILFFIFEFTKIMNKNNILKIGLVIPALLLSIVTLFQTKMEGIVGVFNITMVFLFLLLVFSIVVLVISIVKKKNKKSIIILISFFIVLLTAFSDIYHVLMNFFPFAYIMVFGFLIFLLNIFFLLAFDQAKIFITSQNNTADLNKKNEYLKKMVDNITIVSNNLINSSRRLEESVSTSSEVINNYEENNKQIMDRVFGKFSEIEEMIQKVGRRIDIATEKVPQAIINQTSIVEEISATITTMNTQMEQTMKSAHDSNAAAVHLSELAEKSTEIIKESKSAITTISEYSLFLQEVLSAIEDIADKTSILSINAAIEAARQGIHGKGFSVIAGEISNLSGNTKNTLETSFEKIKDMYDLIERSTAISDEVSKSLFTIIEKIKVSSTMIRNITGLIQEQKTQASAILTSVKNLLEDTFTIKDLTEEEQKENEKIKQTLSELKDTFSAINKLLKDQLQKGTELYTFVNNIRDITGESLRTIDILQKATATGNITI